MPFSMEIWLLETCIDRIYVGEGGDVGEYTAPEKRRHIRFPLCLAVKYGDSVEVCDNFILNICKDRLLIETDLPVQKGSKVAIHLYIPPDNKLLGAFRGEVVNINRSNTAYPRGIHVKLTDNDREEMKKVDDYLEERRHLIDKLV